MRLALSLQKRNEKSEGLLTPLQTNFYRSCGRHTPMPEKTEVEFFKTLGRDTLIEK
jgi:hypothetical protein